MKTLHHLHIALVFVLPTMLFLPRQASAQVITITFQGTLNGTSVPLDSIHVMNLDQGGDTTIIHPVNTLELGAVGMEEAAFGANLLMSMPNPFRGSTDIMVGSTGQGEMVLTVHDAMGREVASESVLAMPGQHRFRFTNASPGMHILNVLQDGQRRTHRMVAMEIAGSQASTLQYIGLSGTSGAPKADRSLFTWLPGDELRYIGYATSNGIVFSAAIDEVPVMSVTHTFGLRAGMVCRDTPTVTDIDGNAYPAVRIGDQCWMARNLNVGHYRDGSEMPTLGLSQPEQEAWSQLTTGAWSSYVYDTMSVTHGRLYNWYAVSDPRGICPAGWHVPTEEEWQVLELELGMPVAELSNTGWRGAIENVGGKMKSTGTIAAGTGLWEGQVNNGATNESGFAGIPGGWRDWSSGSLYGTICCGYWWSASEATMTSSAWYRQLVSDRTSIWRWSENKKGGYSIRCVRD